MCDIWEADSKNSFIFGIIIITFGLVIGILIGFLLMPNLIGCGIMAVVMMITLFIGGYIFSQNHRAEEAEIRRSITIPILAVYFWLLAFGDKIEINSQKSIINDVLENYWLITLIVLGFYFGGRSFEKIIEKIPGKRYNDLNDRIEKLENIK